MGFGNSGFLKGNCEKTNCYISTSKEDLGLSDAVVFHGQDLQSSEKLEQLKVLSQFKKQKKMKGEKSPVFVFFMKEPPQVDLQLSHPVLKVTTQI